MTVSGPHNEPQEAHSKPEEAHGGAVVQLLELMDNWAHVIVAAFFILMAATVIIHMGFIFLKQLPLIIPAPTAAEMKTSVKPTGVQEIPPIASHSETPAHTPELKYEAEAKSKADPKTEAKVTPDPAEVTHAENAADPFVKNSLELLSNILFAVILLELLRTIITYLQTHDIQAIMQEFLVVGIISSVRKILLVGAEASLVGSKNQMEFIQEASGVVINIIGILLLILGLVMLRRAYSKALKEDKT